MKPFDQNSAFESRARRRFLTRATALGASTLMGSHAGPVFAQSRGPLKIGMLDSFSKAWIGLGEDHLDGFNLYLDSVGGEMAGRKVELIREDDELNPQIGLQKLKKLVESDKCDLIVGIQSSAVLMSVVEYVRQSKRLFICTGAGADAASYVNVPNMFRTSTSTWQSNNAMGEWFYANIAKEAVLTASDFAGGRDTLAEFKRSFMKKGGKVIQEIYPALGTTDFSPYLAVLRSINPPATYNFYGGSDATRFVKQYAEAGLKSKIRCTGAGFMVEQDVLPAQGDAALGIINAQHYSDALTNPENIKFVADYMTKYKKIPSVYAEYSYVGARFVHEMLKLTGGDTSNTEAMQTALLKVKFNAPRGPVSLDSATHNVVHNVYVREVARVDGRLTNKVLGMLREQLRDPAVREV